LPMTFFSKTPIECTKHPDSPENGASVRSQGRDSLKLLNVAA
jgi:hypothetical protein